LAVLLTRRGCLVYVKEEIDTIEIESKKFKHVEYIQLGINLNKDIKLLISCIYRSPNSMDIECIEEMREILTTGTRIPEPPFSSFGPSRDYGMDLCLEVYL
jgi:hypothetical protein